MNRSLENIVLTGVALSFLAGCVSTGTFKRAQAENAQLQGQVSTLQQQKSQLEQERDQLTKDNSQLAQEKETISKTSQQNEQQYSALLNQMSDEVKNGQLKVTQYKNMLTVDVAEKIFFASGSATLKSGGKDVLKKLAGALQSYPDKVIRIVGYTDNVPLSKATQQVYPSNWELSVIRATNVVRFLQENGVPPERLIASGRGEYAPIADNSTADGRQKNRRIEIMLLDKSLADTVSPSTGTASAPASSNTSSTETAPSTDTTAP